MEESIRSSFEKERSWIRSKWGRGESKMKKMKTRESDADEEERRQSEHVKMENFQFCIE